MVATAGDRVITTVVRTALRAAVSNTALFRAAAGSGLHVFLFHDVSPAPAEFSTRYGLNVEPQLFRQQIRWIKSHFTVISPSDLAAYRVPADAALITFDDGFAGYFDHAVPVLVEEHVPSLIFLNMEPVHGAVFWSGLVTYLCDHEPAFREKVRAAFPTAPRADLFLYATRALVTEYLEGCGRRAEITESVRTFYGAFATEAHLERMRLHVGHVFFANHLFNHYNAAVLPDHELADAYTANVQALRKYPNFIDFFSYPYGQPGTCYDARTERVIGRLSPLRTFSAVALRNADPNARLLHRVSIDASIDSLPAFRFRAGVLPFINRYRQAQHTAGS